MADQNAASIRASITHGGVPGAAPDDICNRLTSKRARVAVCEQMEDPAQDSAPAATKEAWCAAKLLRLGWTPGK